MASIELYIDNQLCETENPENFSVYLKRQFLNPAELSTKDAQKSYDITLPATATNNAIFGYTNVEEVKGKFSHLYDAQLLVNGIKIFDGKFRLSEITKTSYKGNLGVPAPKSVKDIFGETKLSDNAPMEIDFDDFVESINSINTKAKYEIQKCIFPYVLYGLLPKNAKDLGGYVYSPREDWDETVILENKHIPPSINVMEMLKHIFHTRDYKLQGTALDDIRLNSLYMSYKNDPDYTMPWNYGKQGYVKISGEWTNGIPDGDHIHLEKNGIFSSYPGWDYYTGDLFNSTNIDIRDLQITDPGGNFSHYTVSQNGRTCTKCKLIIPQSGYYKIKLKANLEIDHSRNNWFWQDPDTGFHFAGGVSNNYNNYMRQRRYEIKLLRDQGSDDFGLYESRIDGVYHYDNWNQNMSTDANQPSSYPKYYPQTIKNKDGKPKQVLFVDQKQNPNLVAGLSWGFVPEDYNLKSDSPTTEFGRVLVAKPAKSWDRSSDSDIARLGIDNPGYWYWGKLSDIEDDDSPAMDISTGEKRNNFEFDTKGLLIPMTEPNGTSTILYKYKLEENKTYRIYTPADSDWIGNIYLYNSINENETAIKSPVALPGERTDIDTSDGAIYLSLYLSMKTYDNEFDVTDTISIKEVKRAPDDNRYDWKLSDRLKASINNSPESYARRGYNKDGIYMNSNDWYADGEVNAIVWLEENEKLTIAATSDDGGVKEGKGTDWGWTFQKYNYELEITPFRTDKDWLKIDDEGNGREAMNWNDDTNFQTNGIDLVKFLPGDVSTDDFINNLCKAFNLTISQATPDTFSLDIKQQAKTERIHIIDLDSKTSVRQSKNQSMNLPLSYSIGFTINENEEGYVQSNKGEEGGIIYTGATDGEKKEQKNNFSYNWFKNIRKIESDTQQVGLRLPIISESEVWNTEKKYSESMDRFTNLPLRFWYYDGLLNDLGATFAFSKNKQDLKLAKVSNTLPGLNRLSYKDEENTILRNYFTLLTDANNAYTTVECYLTPDEYNRLPNSWIKLNSDLYYVTEVDGYDPMCKKKAVLKLIRKQ